jgi:hypothetical protein
MTTTLPARPCAYADRNGTPVSPPPGATTVEDWEGGPFRYVAIDGEVGSYEQQLGSG